MHTGVPQKICPFFNPDCDMVVTDRAKQPDKKILDFLTLTFPHMGYAFDGWLDSIKHNNTRVLLDTHNTIHGLLTTSHCNEDTLCVNFVSVDPTLQGSGIGSQLLVLAENEAREKRLRRLSLDTELVKEKNLLFYLSNGWEIKLIDPKGYRKSPSVRFIKHI